MKKSYRPFFSIIIPVFNRADLIERTLSSILAQSYNDFEIIVVDDGSTDNPEEVVRKHADFRVSFYKISNVERGAARNMGAKLAMGKYLNFFDSDDLFLPILEKLQSFIEAKNMPDVIYGGIEQVNEQNEFLQTGGLPYNSFTQNLLHNNFLACGAVFLKKSVALEYPFHEDRRLSSAEDWELWLRIHTKYDFSEFPDKIFKQVHHKSRSITTISAEKVAQRDCYFCAVVIGQDSMHAKYGKKALALFEADRFTFIALSYAEKGQNALAHSFWRKALQSSILVLKRKRFWAVLKKLVFKKYNV